MKLKITKRNALYHVYKSSCVPKSPQTAHDPIGKTEAETPQKESEQKDTSSTLGKPMQETLLQ